MGLSVTKEFFDETDYAGFAKRLSDSLSVMETLLARPGFGQGPMTLGAELELSIIDRRCRAFPINRVLLAESLDSHIQLELDRFNLEYNCLPVPLAGSPFTDLEAQLRTALVKLNALAERQGGRVVPIGILPTLCAEDLEPSAMSDLPRYRALSAELRRLRHTPFAIHIDGTDPLDMTCDDVTLEGANTSFQLHLRVDPADFANTYNAAQLVTPIALAVGANSPTFLGHRLWDETRVALFKQAIDSRTPQEIEWHRPARVSFGHGWVRHGALELFAEAVGLFPPLLPVIGTQDPLDGLRKGYPPLLEELRLHQGTVWRWNRAVYDPAMDGHLRIEFRTLPAGPTALDMAANAAFLIGMTLGLRDEIDKILPSFPFEYAHRNFYRAARHGLDTTVLWPSSVPPSPREIPLPRLASDMIPVAERGLAKFGVDSRDIRRLLEVVRRRLEARMTPARWQRRILDQLETGNSREEALVGLVQAYVRESSRESPVTEWSTAP